VPTRGGAGIMNTRGEAGTDRGENCCFGGGEGCCLAHFGGGKRGDESLEGQLSGGKPETLLNLGFEAPDGNDGNSEKLTRQKGLKQRCGLGKKSLF